MNKVTMSEPVAYAIFAENGNIRLWSKEPQDLPDLDSLGPMHQLVTTEQAEAYANTRVRAALEQAAVVAERSFCDCCCSDDQKFTAEDAAQSIRALIPKA